MKGTLQTFVATLGFIALALGCNSSEQNLPPLPPAEFGPHATSGFLRPTETQKQNPESAPTRSEGPVLASGTLHLAPNLRGRLKHGPWTIFLIAREPTGGPPLAVRKLSIERFPAPFSLTADDLMVPGREVKEPFRLIARLDADGVAGPAQPGDFEGGPEKALAIGTVQISIEIDRAI